MENKTPKTRNILGGGAIDSPIKSPECQKISVRDEKLKIKSSKKAKKQTSCRTRFGICPASGCSQGFILFFNRKIFNKLVSSLRCLSDRCRNEFGMTPNCSGIRFLTHTLKSKLMKENYLYN